MTLVYNDTTASVMVSPSTTSSNSAVAISSPSVRLFQSFTSALASSVLFLNRLSYFNLNEFPPVTWRHNSHRTLPWQGFVGIGLCRLIRENLSYNYRTLTWFGLLHICRTVRFLWLPTCSVFLTQNQNGNRYRSMPANCLVREMEGLSVGYPRRSP